MTIPLSELAHCAYAQAFATHSLKGFVSINLFQYSTHKSYPLEASGSGSMMAFCLQEDCNALQRTAPHHKNALEPIQV